MVPFTLAATSGPAGQGCASFTESSGIVPDFPWAEAGEAKVRPLLLVLIGGGLFHGNADIVSAFPLRASARWC